MHPLVRLALVLMILPLYALWFAFAPYRYLPGGTVIHLLLAPTLIAFVIARTVGARGLVASISLAWVLITLELVRQLGPSAGIWTVFYFTLLDWLPYYVIVTGAMISGTLAGIAIKNRRRLEAGNGGDGALA